LRLALIHKFVKKFGVQIHKFVKKFGVQIQVFLISGLKGDRGATFLSSGSTFMVSLFKLIYFKK